MEEGNLIATLMKNTDIWTDAGTFESLKRANKLMEKYAK
jgi:dTDP-glucose pyrophosphorylase